MWQITGQELEVKQGDFFFPEIDNTGNVKI